MMKPILAACVALSLVGCASELHGPPSLRPAYASPPPPSEEVVGPGGFRASEFAWSLNSGANSIVGSVAHHGKAGGWTCVGQSAALTPQTRYSTDRLRQLYGSSDSAVATVETVRARNAAIPGGDYSKFVRSTTCDANNSFGFANLPDGGYFLIVRVHALGHESPGAAGSVIMQHVNVHGGTARQIILPEQPRHS